MTRNFQISANQQQCHCLLPMFATADVSFYQICDVLEVLDLGARETTKIVTVSEAQDDDAAVAHKAES